MYDYVRHKLNPKLLFKRENIALFMKSNCLKVNNYDYNFVRMNNIISTFLHKQLSTRNINLLFLNLSQRNFEMVSQESPLITFFVLSADSIV